MLKALEASRARIEDIELKILDLERSISELQAEKALLQNRLNSYKYPVLTLPNEILSEIFFHFMPIYPECPPLSGTLSPTLLTQICHIWREIALATPALWSAVSLSTTATIHFDRQLPISKIWLTRSRNSPLSIHIIETDFRSRASEFFAPVFEHQARYEHLKLHLTRSQLPAMGEAMPLLRHLDLQFIGAPGVFALREAPLLRSVSLDVDVSCVVLPWAQLTSLRWHYIFPGEFILILRQTPNLVNCEVDILFGGGSDLPDIVTLPCLEALVLDDPWDGPSTAERLGLLSTFFIPALQRLRISERILKPNPIRSLASFINESGCQLREVHITGTSACPLSVPEDTYREAFSSIQMFSFSGPYHQEREEDLEVESGSSDGSSDGENNSA